MLETLGSALSILYLVITPFIWRKLMQPLERVGWVSGLILAGTGLISWVYGDLSLSYKLPIGITAIVVLAVTGIWHRIKKQSSNENQSENPLSPILEEYKQKYNTHVKELFNIVISNIDENTKNYYEAVRKTHDEKKLLLEHFSTLSIVHQEYSNLYVWYRAIIAMYNDLDRHSKELQSLAGQFFTDIYKIGFYDPPSENWIQMKDFESAFGVNIPTLIDILRSTSDNVEIIISDHIQCDFPIVYDDSKKEWRIGFENNRFAGSKSEEKIKQLSNYIKEEGKKIVEQSSDSRSKRRTIKEMMESGFNEQFNDLYQTIKYGEPKVGACDSCIEWFNGKEQEKLRLILNNLHKNYEFLEESRWTREKIF
jgi:peroxiredoxin family protein